MKEAWGIFFQVNYLLNDTLKAHQDYCLFYERKKKKRKKKERKEKGSQNPINIGITDKRA